MVNSDTESRWSDDIAQSVLLYNDWYIQFAPRTFNSVRSEIESRIRSALRATDWLRQLDAQKLSNSPELLEILRQCTAPPLARDRVSGLADVPRTLLESMERDQQVPPKMKQTRLVMYLGSIVTLVYRIIDHSLFPWLEEKRDPTEYEQKIAAVVLTDRLCGTQSDPLIRNAQEARQLEAIETWLKWKGYRRDNTSDVNSLKQGRYAIHLVVKGLVTDTESVNIPTDIAIKRLRADKNDLPLLVEAKSAGDYTNVNKRRKEESAKMENLVRMYGNDVPYILFLGGYFNKTYLKYIADNGFDWVWEHRVDDLAEFGV